MTRGRMADTARTAAIAVCLAALALPVLPVVLAVVLALVLWARVTVLLFRLRHGRHGRELVVVYSDSPNWRDYVEREWLPRWGSRAVVLNWSERRRWARWTPEVLLFRTYAGWRNVNPLVIVVPRWWRGVTIVRFFAAFRAARHGRPAALADAERQVDAALAR